MPGYYYHLPRSGTTDNPPGSHFPGWEVSTRSTPFNQGIGYSIFLLLSSYLMPSALFGGRFTGDCFSGVVKLHPDFTQNSYKFL